MSKQTKRIVDLSPEKRALLMLRLKKKGEGATKPTISKRSNQEVYPLSYAQERMWFLDQFTPGSPLYNISAAVRLRGLLDLTVLHQCMNTILSRHDVLRASFITQQGEPVQVIAPTLSIELPIEDLTTLSPELREARAQKIAQEEAQGAFKLRVPPLIRIRLMRLAENEHILTLTIHHIIADGWSIGVIIRELAILYQAYATNKPSPLFELPIQYADFAVWQRDWLQEAVLEQQLSFWKNQLKGSNTIIELPTDYARPAVQSFKGQRQSFWLSPALSAALKELSTQENVTLFMTLLAAFKTLLMRYTGQTDLNVGTPIANRTRPELEGLVGFFINTLVLRTQFDDRISFRELLKQVKETALNAFAHQDLPFEKLVEEMGVARDMSHTPLFQVVFDLQKSLLDSFKLPELEISVLETENQTAKFDLMLQFEEGQQQVRGIFEYNTDLFAPATISRMQRHLETLLEGIVANPEQSLATLPLLDAAEEKLIVTDWNATATDYPHTESLAKLFTARVRRTPEAIAVDYNGEKLTYAELNQRANQVAHCLQSLGVGLNDFVATVMERSLDLIVATLGIIKAGAVYVPLDTAYPGERIAFMLQDTQAPVLLTQAALVPGLPENNAQVICIDTDWEKMAHQKVTEPPCEATGESLAYVIYTSGSTGIPKGVAVRQRSITRLVINTDYIQIKSTDRFAQASNASFDAATLEIWGALLNGATLVGIDKDVVLSAQKFVQVIRQEQITAMFLTTSLFNQIANEIPDAFHTIETVIFGGEAADPNAVRKVVQSRPPARLLNGYGPTENTTFSTWFQVFQVADNASNIPIGKPLANSTAYILDRNLNPTPIGVPGELYVGGAGVAQAYWNRPELTSEKFVPDPFSQRPGSLMYRTGDLVRYLPDGNIEFLGRIDNQVKVRGFRIELGEIEATLKNYPGLRDVVIMARKDDAGPQRLVAYVVPEGEAPGISDLRHFMLEKLPDYMVPSHFMILDKLPLNPNGKVDRKALPAPDQARPDLAREYVAPRSQLEQKLAEMWQEILGIEQVGIYDNFFELGGNSLQAAVFINRLQKEFNEEAHVRSIFLAPTIAEFSMYINEYYPDLVAKFFGTESADQTVVDQKGIITQRTGKINQQVVDQLRQIIAAASPGKAVEQSSEKNPPAIFVLSPPRSGSTLFRVMLAGHPKLFAPPELDILSFNSLAERKTAFSEDYEIWLEATWRAIMEVKKCDVETARQIMEECERQRLSSQQFYRLLQDWIVDKILVDKTPSYSMDLAILNRAEAYFENTLYIHLTRHPYATIYSFLEAKLDKNFFRYDHPFSRRELAELIWLVGHQNILAFLKAIPPERQCRINFESLVNQPEPVIRQICEFLKINFHPALLKPYEGKRMTDGVKPSSQMVGDFKFYLHRNIDHNAAERWRKVHTENFLSDLSWDLALKLGYEKTADLDDSVQSPTVSRRKTLAAIKPIPRTGELPLSFQQQRLWFLDQMEPGSSAYNIPAAIQIEGPLNLEAVEHSLNEIIRRHEVLRTRFVTEDGRPRLNILPELKIKLKYHDLTALPVSDRQLTDAQIVTTEAGLSHPRPLSLVRRGVQIVTTEAGLPFDLTTEALIRATVFKEAAEKHVVLLTLHHIIADGWSTTIIIREFAQFYQAFVDGRTSPLPELKIQYVDYACWQRQWLAGEVLQTQLNYWGKQLKDAPPLLELPTDRPRPAELTYHGASESFNLSKELTSAVKNFCHQEGVTEFMTLLAVFQTLLYRYSGQTDISVGTPIANRGRAEIEGLIGFFVNTLVLRTDLSDKPAFRNLLQKVRETVLGAFAHQNVPFEMLVDKIQPERNMSHSPLFQVMFAFQNMPGQELELPHLTIRPFPIPSITAKFDLTLSIREFEREFRGTLEYNTDLFDATTIQRMLGHFETLLKNSIHQPEASIAELSLLPPAEYQQMVVDWNQTQADFPGECCLPELFEIQTARTPEALAVVSENQHLSYQELNQRANQLAHYLRRLGVGPDVLVGIYVERSIELLVGIWGILKAGGAYVPLDPAYPQSRIEYILADAHLSLVLALKRSELPKIGENTRYIYLDSDWETIGQESPKNPEMVTQPENLAYLIYTSGSTGNPKGVMIQQRSAINLWNGLQKVIYDHQPKSSLRISLNAPLLFDASVQQLVMLLSGHTVDILPQAARQEGTAMLNYLREHQIEGLDCVPSQLKLLLAEGLLDEKAWKPRVILPGGEAIDEATWQRLRNSPETEFFNMYGPTECTVDSTVCPIRTADRQPVIGKPINNAQFYIVDRHLQPVPMGVFGELLIGGAGLARGYLNRADLTAEKFIPNPFSTSPGDRLYRTGDLVRYRPDGNIEFLGRIDHQVKVRGFRIELGEIETTLEQHPALKEVVVIVREDVPGSQRLVGYVVPENGETANISELRRFLKNKLPEYMIPALFVTLETLPLTPNGKIDRKALPAPDQSRPTLEKAYVAPRNPVEAKLAEILQGLLGLEKVGVFDNFFELGGDSILSIQMIARAKKAGIQLTPKLLFQHPTIAGLAEVAGNTRTIQAEQGMVTGEIPLTPIQQAFFEQNLPEPNHWNQSILLEVRERLDTKLLESVLKTLLQHHDALRLRFKQTPTGWLQENSLTIQPIPFEVIDLSNASPAEMKTDLLAEANRVQSNLNLTEGPILRLAYFRLGHQQSDRLLIVIHHLAIDGVSWRILMEDLYTAYQQLSQGESIQLSAKTSSFKEWSQKLSEYARSAIPKTETDYWLALGQGELTLLPQDFSGGENTEKTAATIEMILSVEETQALLQDVPPVYGTEINDVLLTALVQAFYRWTEQRTLLVDLEGHGREALFEELDLSRTVGWFTSLFPVRLEFNPGQNPGEALKNIKELLRQIPRKGIHYGLLRYQSGDEALIEQLKAIPPAQVCFNYLGQFEQTRSESSPFNAAPETGGIERGLANPRQHPVSISGSIAGKHLKMTWSYSQALHRRETIDRLAKDFMNALREIIAHCQSTEAGGYTPSDFQDVNLNQEEIDDIMAELNEQ